MLLKDRIAAFSQLGDRLQSVPEDEFVLLAQQAFNHNTWFTEESVRSAFSGLSILLDPRKLEKLTEFNAFAPSKALKVGVVMAGNIPMVGFHDLMSVVLSGHICHAKLSSQDQILMNYLIQKLIEISPDLANQMAAVDRLTEMDAVIATGSDNSARYFESYFGKYPHIIRKNRTSIAVLDGTETHEELTALGRDIFTYFGLGCRNVSKLYIPEEYELPKLLDVWAVYKNVANNNKYINNYDYQKSIALVNGDPHLDTGFLLLKENDQLVSPLSVLYYQRYHSKEDLVLMIDSNRDKIQCTVGHASNDAWISFGQTQHPEPWDYADGVNTLEFLSDLG
ncbi:MAG: hypothetical protein ACI8QD_001215 [Cyclobacteriaceae bacterium]|jgi:hypothetical protein